MTRRDRDIGLLLGSILDAPFAQPKGMPLRGATRGEAPSHRIPCPSCLGHKRRRIRTVLQDCDRCVGAKGRPLGYIVVDGMIDERYRRRIGTAETGVEHQLKVVICDGCGGRELGNGRTCRHCRGSGIQELELTRWRSTRAAFELEVRQPAGDPVIGAMEARERAGSYDELAAALAELRAAWPALFRLTVRRYVRGENLGSENERLERFALPFLSARMPEEIRVPGHLRRQRVAA